MLLLQHPDVLDYTNSAWLVREKKPWEPNNDIHNELKRADPTQSELALDKNL